MHVQRPDDRPTLPSTVVEDEPDNDNEQTPVLPSEVITPELEVRIDARPVFCCDPLAVELEVQTGDPAAMEGPVYSWNLGDERTARGAAITHTYGGPA
jgi:hypothetical protein